MEDHEAWEGTATELLDALEGVVDERIKKAHGWPKAAHSLSGKLKRSATALRSYGIEVFYPQRTGKQKLMRLEKRVEKSVTSVTDLKKTAQAIDIKVDSTMTLLTDRSVTGASQKHKMK